MPNNHMLIAGASGLVGFAAARHFSQLADWTVTAISRRQPPQLDGITFESVDLADARGVAEFVARTPDVTHVVFAAYAETPGIEGWQEPEQMALNLSMLRHLMEPLLARAGGFRHITLLQGTKAYGPPGAVIPIPARERSKRGDHAVFYWYQEDYLRSEQARRPSWSWTILRPQIIFGESLGSHMNVMPAIGAYAAVLKADGERLYFPGGASWIREAVDADLLARACAWAALEPACGNEAFNITNGDVFEWRNVWPAIADALGMEPGPDRPQSLAETMPARQADWRSIVQRHRLRAPEVLSDFVGQGFLYADRQFCFGLDQPPPARLVSTIKARQAGFTDCVDTEDMFRTILRRFQQRGWLPAPG